jgi:hypothetical protein
MPLKDDYQRIAYRSLNACDATIAAGIQEKAAFLAYHAFESAGSALSSHLGMLVGPRVSHYRKIDLFRQGAQQLNRGRGVARIAFTIGNLRNTCLYPVKNTGGGYDLPEALISLPQVRDLRRSVGGIVTMVGEMI